MVTGGGRGFGRILSTHLAQAGAKVVICARTEEPLRETVRVIKRAGGEANAYTMDVAKNDSVTNTFERIRKECGPIDLLVNNAGVGGPLGPLWEVDPYDWWYTLEVNLHGVFNCTRTVLKEMTRRREGRIINIVSHAGVKRWPLLSAYAVSKSAVIKFTENLAFETNRFNVKVFAVHPGLLRIGLSEWTSKAKNVPAESPRGKVLAWLRKEFQLGKDVPPERAADLIVLLASGKADALTGRYITIYDNVKELVEKAKDIWQNDLLTLGLKT